MLYFSNLQHKSVPEQLFSFADAYLESAAVLSKNLCAEVDHANYAHGAVIMSLTFHALELFLKAAILQKEPNEKFPGRNGHDLSHLEKRYSNLYPGNRYTFDIIFRCQAPRIDGLDPVADELIDYMQKQEKEIPQDQIHRYPINRENVTWNVLLGFEPNTFDHKIVQVKADFARLKAYLQDG